MAESDDGIAGSVGVYCGQRTFMAGIHGLQHVEGFFSAHLAYNDAVGAHAKAVDQQLTLVDRSLSFDVGRTGFKAHDVFMAEAEFGRIFDGDEALVMPDVLSQDVQKGGLAGAGAAGDEDADPGFYRGGQHFHHFR